jgi:hypothetical protein
MTVSAMVYENDLRVEFLQSPSRVILSNDSLLIADVD